MLRMLLPRSDKLPVPSTSDNCISVKSALVPCVRSCKRLATPLGPVISIGVDVGILGITILGCPEEAPETRDSVVFVVVGACRLSGDTGGCVVPTCPAVGERIDDIGGAD